MLVKPISSPRLFVVLICASIGMVGLYIGAVLPRRAQVAIGDNQRLIQFVSEVIIEHPDFLAYSKTQDDKVWGKPEGATIVAKWIRTNWIESRQGLTETQILGVSARVSSMMSDLVVERDFDPPTKSEKV